MAGPLKTVDEELLKKLATIHCSLDEMALILKVDRNTLKKNYGELIDQCMANGRMGIKRTQFQIMQEGENDAVRLKASMFLGTQYCGQSEKTVVANISIDDPQKQQDVAILLDDLAKAFELKEVKPIEEKQEPMGLIDVKKSE